MAERGAESNSVGRACAACGASARRDEARFCAACGRALGEDYFPTDSLRASYSFARRAAQAPPKRVTLMPEKRENGAATTGLAFVTYALVPYLGILFCPGALVMGGVGLWRARRVPHLGGRRAAALSLLLGLAILCAQLLLWWALYKVPEWSKSF